MPTEVPEIELVEWRHYLRVKGAAGRDFVRIQNIKKH